MNGKQKILVVAATLLHFVLAALCVVGDTPSPGNQHDAFPVLTMFMLAPFLATGMALVAAGATGFWLDSQRSWLALTAMGTMAFAFYLVYSRLGEPFMWLYFLPWVAAQYGCSLITLCAVRWVYHKLGGSGPDRDSAGEGKGE